MASQGDSSVSGARPASGAVPPPAVPPAVPPPLLAPLFQPLAPIAIRLDRDNYVYWRSQVLPAVRARDLDGFLLGTRVCPPQFVDLDELPPNTPPQVNPSYTLWLRTDQALLSWLLNSISEAMLGHVLRCHFSAELRLLLDTLFATQSRARILQLRFQLQSLKKGSLTINDYVLKMKSLADGLTAAGQVFTDEDLILYILGGLGPEYDSVVINFTSRGDRISLSEVQFLLQSQELRIDQQTSLASDVVLPSAQYASRGRRPSAPPPSGRPPNPRGRGRGRGRGRNGNNFNRITCQMCTRTGHSAAKCYHRFDPAFTPPPPSSSHSSPADPSQQTYIANTGSSGQQLPPDDPN